MSLLSYFFPQRIYSSTSLYNKKIEVIQNSGVDELLVNGIVQTGRYTSKLWQKGLQPIFAASLPVSDILVLGVGGGTVFPLFAKKFPNSEMTGVDIDEEVIAVGNKYFGFSDIPHLKLVTQDARTFVKNPMRAKKYDVVVVDLYTGNDVPSFVTKKPFLTDVGRVLKPGGRMVINYFDAKNQASRAQIVFDNLALAYVQVERKSVLRNIFFYVVK
jgi:spermidine synthase